MSTKERQNAIKSYNAASVALDAMSGGLPSTIHATTSRETVGDVLNRLRNVARLVAEMQASLTAISPYLPSIKS